MNYNGLLAQKPVFNFKNNFIKIFSIILNEISGEQAPNQKVQANF